MRHTLLFVLAFAALAPSAGAVLRQSDDSEVASRGWVTERPKQRQQARPHRHTTSPNPPPRSGGAKVDPHDVPAPATSTRPVALGYTLYKIDANGNAVSVTPETTFTAGDKVRLRIEPNAEGYLYVFDTENDRNPIMIFPDPRLDNGDNYIDAHAGLDVPSATRTFKIAGDPGVDRLYVLLTREPLAGVPREDELVKYCKDFASACPFRPSEAQWNVVTKWASEPVRVTTARAESYAHRSADADLGGRSVVLSDDDPPPSVIGESASKQAGVVVVKVDLKHP